MKKLTKEKLFAGIAILLIAVAFILVIVLGSRPKEQAVYREDMVKRGNLLVGITQDGSVDMGVLQQIFEMELDEENEFVIEQVCITEGQTVQEGDILYLLEEEAVTKLRKELQSALTEAQTELKVMNAEQELAKQDAKYLYDSSMAYGGYADQEYDATIRALEDAVTKTTEDLASAKSILSTYEEQLKGIKTDYNTASTVLKNCENSRDKTNRTTNMYKYIEYFELAEEAQSNLDSLGQKKEELEAKVAQAKQNVESYTKQLKIAKRELEFGVLEAQETRELRKLAYDKAQENYDFTLDYLAENAKKQQAVLDAAQQKWDQFNTFIIGNAVKANHNGVVSNVNLKVGDILKPDMELVTMYDLDDVSMTVKLSEKDMADIADGSSAQVVFEAYPDRVFRARVTDIPGEETVSGGDAGENVTIALQGETTGLLQGMTGEITFITKEVRNVIYVSNHAVNRVGFQTYVTLKDAEGNMAEQEVITGFSDGRNVEIKEGLSVKDVVCYNIGETVADGAKTLSDIRVTEGQQLVHGNVVSVKGNEVTYSVEHPLTESVSDSDVEMQGPVWQEIVTVLLPVGSMENFTELTVGDEIALVTEIVEEEQVIIEGYILQQEE